MTKEELKEQDIRLNRLCFDYHEKEKRIAELEKENAELLCQKNRNKSCYSCANATERCFRNEIGCPCQKYKSYTEENAELKKKILDTQDAVIVLARLKEGLRLDLRPFCIEQTEIKE